MTLKFSYHSCCNKNGCVRLVCSHGSFGSKVCCTIKWLTSTLWHPWFILTLSILTLSILTLWTPICQFPLCQLPLHWFRHCQLPGLSTPTSLTLTKWELTMWELMKWEADKVESWQSGKICNHSNIFMILYITDVAIDSFRQILKIPVTNEIVHSECG